VHVQRISLTLSLHRDNSSASRWHGWPRGKNKRKTLPDSAETTVAFQPPIRFFAMLVWMISGDRGR
jgi:hypothetical protein